MNGHAVTSRLALASLLLALAAVGCGVLALVLDSALLVFVGVGLFVLVVAAGSAGGRIIARSGGKRRGTRLLEFSLVLAILALLLGMAEVALARVRETTTRIASACRLRQIGTAMLTYHDEHGHLPPAAIYSKAGKPLLSWRVLLLPYLEHDDLYRAFHLDEPWDSPHNIQLLDRMPVIYRRPINSPTDADSHSTIYQVFVGPGSLFEQGQERTLGQIANADGTSNTSNTLLVVEAGELAPWTQPAELVFAADQPLPALGGLFTGQFRPFGYDPAPPTFGALFANAHVASIPLPDGDETLVRALITWNGKEVVRLP